MCLGFFASCFIELWLTNKTSQSFVQSGSFLIVVLLLFVVIKQACFAELETNHSEQRRTQAGPSPFTALDLESIATASQTEVTFICCVCHLVSILFFFFFFFFFFLFVYAYWVVPFGRCVGVACASHRIRKREKRYCKPNR